MSVWSGWLLWQYPAQQWWQQSWVGQWSGSLQQWRQTSWLGRWLEPFSLAIAVVYLAFSSHAATGPLGLVLFGMAGLVALQWVLLPPVPTPLHLPIGIFWLVATMATLLSPVQQLAMEGWIKLSLYFCSFLLLHRLFLRPRFRNWLVTCLLLVMTWVSVYGIRQFFFGAEELATWVDPESGLAGTTRVYSYLDNPNLLAGYLLPAIPIGFMAAWIWSNWGAKVFAVTVTGLNLACLIFTLSRGGWIGLLAALVVTALLLVQWNQVFLPAQWRPWIMPLLIGGGAIAIGLAVLFVEPLRLRVLSIFQWRGDSSNNFRINVWIAVLHMIRDFPILGIGPGNDAFNRIYPLYQLPNYSALGTYSIPLEILVETGIVGGLTYLWFVVVLAAHGLRRWFHLLRDRDPAGLWVAAGLAACAGMMVHGLVDTVWYRPQVHVLWWFCVALISSRLVSPSTSAADGPSERGG